LIYYFYAPLLLKTRRSMTRMSVSAVQQAYTRTYRSACCAHLFVQ